MVVPFVGVLLWGGLFWDALKHGSPLCGGLSLGWSFWDALKHGSPLSAEVFFLCLVDGWYPLRGSFYGVASAPR